MHRRLIVVANRTCPCPGLADEVAAHLDPDGGSIFIVAPALNSRLRHWVSDTDEAVELAMDRLRQAVFAMREAGMHTEGTVGDADPLQAIDDTLAEFPADAVLLSTWPHGASNWLERDLITKARSRFDIPIHHVVSRYDAPVLTSS